MAQRPQHGFEFLHGHHDLHPRRLVLIILLTGIDASQITVLVATPKEMPGDDKSPVFFECRSNQLFHISVDELKKACDAKTEELRQLVQGDETEFLKQAGQTIMESEGQRLDYTYALLGKYVLMPIPGAEGYKFIRYLEETDQMWFGSRLAKINPGTQFICFFVRPDSYKIFQQARALAWLRDINVVLRTAGREESHHDRSRRRSHAPAVVFSLDGSGCSGPLDSPHEPLHLPALRCLLPMAGLRAAGGGGSHGAGGGAGAFRTGLHRGAYALGAEPRPTHLEGTAGRERVNSWRRPGAAAFMQRGRSSAATFQADGAWRGAPA